MKYKNTIQKVMILLHRLQPGLLPLIILMRCISAVHPFVNLFFGSRILDMVVGRRSMEEIMKIVCLMVLLNAVLGLVRWALEKVVIVKKRVLSEKIYELICVKTLTIDYEVLEYKETLERIQKADEGMNSHGDIGAFCDDLGRIVEDVSKIVYAAILLVSLFIPMPLKEVTWLGRILNSPFSSLILVFSIVFSMIIGTQLKKWMQKAEKTNFDRNIKLNQAFSYFFSFVWDYGQGKYIRLYGMRDLIVKMAEHYTKQTENNSREMVRQSHKATLIRDAVMFLLQATGYVYIGLKATLGLISVGSVLQYVGSFQQFYNGVQNILFTYVNMDMRSRYLSHFYDYMELKNKKYEGTLPVEKRDDNQFEIEFRDVSFRYPNSNEMVLSHLNTKIKLGEKTAVVGKNGAGKTTFIKLLCRLYDPTEGQILLNGIDIKLYDYREYIGLFSVVFQDFKLFSFSVGENVATSAEYDEEKATACLKQAGFEERLSTMPQGIHTNIYQVEDNGVEISGGEAQKIAIARALYKDAPFVILDEPTSALDPVSEYEIYRHFDQLVKDKTSIYISHRMSSCRFCDNIYVFDGGRIIQAGSHEELMQKEEGLYHQLWQAQAQYYTKVSS